MTRPSPALTIIAAILTFVVITAPSANAEQEKIHLRDDSTVTAPGLSLQSSSDDRCTVTFDLPFLHQQTLAVDGQTYQALTIPDGGLAGKIGQPGLPTFSGMLALPIGRSVQFNVLARDDKTFANTQVLPVQPEDADEFVIDDVYYSAAAKQQSPTVILGDPAIMHGQRVVPFVIIPVACDPAAGTVTASSHLEIEFTFEGRDDRNNPRVDNAKLPASFANLHSDRVINADRSVGADGLGTYLVICPDNVGVVNALQPLLEWRKRQGYTVQLATTAETGPSRTAIKSFIQGIYNSATIPLEFVVLVGDHSGSVPLPTWFENSSGYGGEGDHYYTELEGDDVLPDIFLGRLSCTNTSELTTIVNKIVNYETAPPTGDAGWFTRASLTADPSASGTSTIYVSQWMKAQLEMTGFTQVDTFWSGNYASQMLNSLNQGLSVFTYRGYLGMSGFGSGHISSSSNGGKLPFAIFPTCASGSWASESNARNEAFLRAPNGGGIGAIGLATIGTHTRYNNCLFHGIGETVIHGSDHRLGVAQAGGKLEMFAHYQMFEPDKVEIWSVWSSLIGDPATDVWLSYPRTLTVEHPSSLPVGVGSVPITVTEGGAPVAGAVVAVYKDGEISVSAITDAAGQAVLVLPTHSDGSLLVTVWGHGLMPYRGSLDLGEVDRYLDLAETELDGDGIANPAETLQLTCALTNRGTELTGAVSATLTSDDPYVTILDGTDSFGDIAAGATAWGEFQIEVASTAPDGHELALVLTAGSGASEWVSAMRLPVTTSNLAQTDYNWSVGGSLDPGESGNLSVTLTNSGDLTAYGITSVLATNSPWVTVIAPNASFGDIPMGGSATNGAVPFSLTIAPDCFQGHLATFDLTVTQSNGAVQVVEFSLPVGSVSSDDPVGPDTYGYYAYDNTDVNYPQAPTFDWVEIDPNYGGSGTSVGLDDFSYEQDDTKVIDLPFTFTYYGQDYDQIAVCSNGWIAMGNTTLVHWRNWSIPSAGSPDALIAPFWDDLKQSGTNQVYAWYDESNDRFIVQWSRMTNRHSGMQNIEVILHDPLAHSTPTGDGDILFQYETVTNNDNSRGYATTGIQNLDGTDGVLYTYYNHYAPGAAPLVAGRAILFKAAGVVTHATCDVTPASFTVNLEPDQQTVETLRIENNGDIGSVLRYELDKVDPNPPAGAQDSDKNLTGSTLTADPGTFTPGATVDIVLTATCVSNDAEWLTRIEADFPPGIIVNSATEMSAEWNFEYAGELGDGALAVWQFGRLINGQQGFATVNVTFAEVTGPVDIPYNLYGDEYGQPPHEVFGIITLTPNTPAVFVLAPNGGESWAEGEERAIEFSSVLGPETLRIELDRGDGSGWETLADDVPSSDGSYPWTVTGPMSAHCLVRISDMSDPSLQDISDNEFIIGRDLSWVTVGEYSGVVTDGEGENIDLSFDSTGLAVGTYQAELIVTNTAGAPITVPITMVVGGTTSAESIPSRLELAKNYPNPFNPRTTIAFSLPADGPVRLQIFDMRGRLVKTLHDGGLPAGHHSLMWDGTDNSGRRVASGLFVYRLASGNKVLSQKMMLMK